MTLLCLVGVVFSYAMFQGGFVSWFLFYSLIPMGLYALSLFFYDLKHIHVKRELVKAELTVGEKLKVTLKLRRRFPFPLLYLVVKEQFSSMERTTKVLLIPGFRKEMSCEYIIEHLPRGEHFLQSVHLKTGDPFGLMKKETVLTCENKIIVYPKVVDIVYSPLINRHDHGIAASMERIQRETTVATGVRKYQPGDRYSWINWKASAKRNEMMTKEFEQPHSHYMLLVMDRSPNVYFEDIVSFTASLMKAMTRKGIQISLLSFGPDRVFFPCGGGIEQERQLFHHFIRVADNSAVPLDRVLDMERISLRQSAAPVIITGQLNKAIIEKVGQYTSQGAATIFLIQGKKDKESNEEHPLLTFALSRGIHVKIVDAFSEVSR
ncbi:DUF58 domain-containing protein [Bacillus aquiflavi]|nr:DUF58 domain-containing protein [Bacillus aquiflavi]